jgi:hypothetical protein
VTLGAGAGARYWTLVGYGPSGDATALGEPRGVFTLVVRITSRNTLACYRDAWDRAADRTPIERAPDDVA